MPLPPSALPSLSLEKAEDAAALVPSLNGELSAALIEDHAAEPLLDLTGGRRCM